MKQRIDTSAARSNLAPRREPYWMAIPDIDGAYVGFRRGPDTWIARIREEGRQRIQALGRHPDHKDAIRAARSWIQDRQMGVLDHNATVTDACEAYLANLKSEKSIQAATEAAARLRRWVLGRKFTTREHREHSISRVTLAKLRPDQLKEWRSGLVPPDLNGEALRKARASANRNIAALIAALNFAFRQRMVASDFAWAADLKFKDTQARKQRRVLSHAERTALLAAAKGAIRDFLEGLMLTGARPIELTRLNVSDYDLIAGTLALTSYKGRRVNANVRHFPVRVVRAERLIDRLCKDKLPTAPLFTRDDGRRWQHGDWDELVRTARDAAGIKNITAYDLRHTFITEALTGGVDPLTVSEMVGTSLQQITVTYGKLVESHALKAFAHVKLL